MHNLQIASGDVLHISTLPTVKSCTIMYVFSMNKILFTPTGSSDLTLKFLFRVQGDRQKRP